MECQSTRLKIVFLEIDLIFFRMPIDVKIIIQVSSFKEPDQAT
jgi:hypothetical protein